jgi:glycosyltransferase involved in cell wall biosynthesis
VDRDDPILGFFHRWIEEFAHHFEQVHIICLKEGKHALPPNVTVYSLGKESGENRGKYLLRFYRYFTKIFFGKRPNFVFFHMGAIYNILGLPFFLLRKITHTKFIWWKTHGLLNTMGKLALWGVDEVVTAGSESFNAKSNKVRVVGHAIDTNHFVEGHQGVPGGEMRLMAVGRVTPIKKLELAILVTAAFNKAAEYKATFHIYGPATNHEYKQKLEQLIVDNDYGAVVQWCGTRTPAEMPREYHTHDVLLHPAFEAGFDKVVLEAMASGVIPLTSIPSFEPILAPFGLYIRANDVEGYAAALARIVHMDAGARDKLSKNLREIVVQNHSIHTLPKRVFGV